jgi:predicted nuclease with TOPRIM domain
MFRFLKGLMKGGEPPAPGEALRADDLPLWIGSEEERVREDLAALVAAHRPGILGALGRMEETISSFDTASMEDVPHRKLAGVTERSLPLFLKAMRTSLSRDLPEDPEGFYLATGEILKGCLSAFRGQGRYLASRFPVEMRALRDGVDAMGREANAMTPGIARARERLRGLSELRDALRGFTDARERIARGQAEIRTLRDREEKARGSLDATMHALAELEGGREYLECQGELDRIKKLEENRAGTAREYHALAAAAFHLLKKAEKIALRKKVREDTRVLREAIALLEGELPVPAGATSTAIPPAQEVLSALVASGDLAPKNREETDLIGRPGHLLRGITDLSERFRGISAAIASAQDALFSRPAIARKRDLEKDREILGGDIARVQDRLGILAAEVGDLEGRMQASLEVVKERIGILSGGSVRFLETEPGKNADRQAMPAGENGKA